MGMSETDRIRDRNCQNEKYPLVTRAFGNEGTFFVTVWVYHDSGVCRRKDSMPVSNAPHNRLHR